MEFALHPGRTGGEPLGALTVRADDSYVSGSDVRHRSFFVLVTLKTSALDPQSWPAQKQGLFDRV